jgi:hypothetical protein
MPELTHRLQLLVRADRRLPEHMQQAVEVARRLGLAITGRGAASLSARVSHSTYQALFGSGSTAAAAVSSHPSPPQDIVPLPVPASLSEFIDSITEAPGHLYMDDKNRSRK